MIGQSHQLGNLDRLSIPYRIVAKNSSRASSRRPANGCVVRPPGHLWAKRTTREGVGRRRLVGYLKHFFFNIVKSRFNLLDVFFYNVYSNLCFLNYHFIYYVMILHLQQPPGKITLRAHLLAINTTNTAWAASRKSQLHAASSPKLQFVSVPCAACCHQTARC